ncbi:MAG: hypothetical protein ACXVBH_02495 [Flavisolibacter sp.]
MNIEFYTPSKLVNELLVASVRDAILHLHKQHSTISKAGVSFRQRRKIVTTERICEIRFFISGKMNIISASADTFEKAVRKAIDKLEDAIAAHFKAHPEPLETTLGAVEA